MVVVTQKADAQDPTREAMLGGGLLLRMSGCARVRAIWQGTISKAVKAVLCGWCL